MADIVNQSQPTVSRRKKNNSFPIEWAYSIGDKYNINPKWILTGEGNQNSDNSERSSMNVSGNQSPVVQAGGYVGNLNQSSKSDISDPELFKLTNLLSEYASPAEIKLLIKKFENRADALED